MTATPRNDVVKLRLTTLEKRDWSEAAGGTRKLSEWIRAVCNAEAASTRDPDARPLGKTTVDARPGEGESLTDSAAPLSATDEGVPGVNPPVVFPSGRARTGTPRVAVTVGQPEPRDDSSRQTAARGASGTECSRWMHHRPGVYCGTCKTVVKK